MEEDEEEEDDYEESGDGGEGFGGEEYILVLHSVKNDRSKHMMGDKSVSTLPFNPFLKKLLPRKLICFKHIWGGGGGGRVVDWDGGALMPFQQPTRRWYQLSWKELECKVDKVKHTKLEFM